MTCMLLVEMLSLYYCAVDLLSHSFRERCWSRNMRFVTSRGAGRSLVQVAIATIPLQFRIHTISEASSTSTAMKHFWRKQVPGMRATQSIIYVSKYEILHSLELARLSLAFLVSFFLSFPR